MTDRPKLSPISLDQSIYPIKVHHTWDTWDSTKTVESMRCMRRAFYRYVLGWTPEYAVHDLVFGSCWHLAMDYMYKNGLSIDSIPAAMDVFNEEYRKQFDPFTDLDYEPKSPAHAEAALESYVIYRHNDQWSVMSIDEPCDKCKNISKAEMILTGETNPLPRACEVCGGSGKVSKPLIEVSGSVPVSDKWRMSYRLDKVMSNQQGHVIVRDHKTAKIDNQVNRESWTSKMQPNLYGHALLCLVDQDRYRGVELDITFFRKKDMTNRGIDRHLTAPVYRDKDLTKGWLWDTLHWLDQIEWNFEQLSKSSVDDEVLKAFPKNENGCTAYFKLCPYYHVCHTQPGLNPLKLAETPPFGFIINYWDPAERVGEKEGKVYHFDGEKV